MSDPIDTSTPAQPEAGGAKGIGSKAVKASVWVMGGVVFTRLANLLMTVILARILLPQDFGLVALGTTVLLMLQAVTDLALGNALIHKHDANRADYDTAFTLGVLRGLLLMAIMIGAGAVMVKIYSDPRLFAIMAAISLRPLMAGLMSPYYITLAKHLKFSVVIAIESLAAVLQLVAAVGVAWTTHSYWGIVAGVIAAGLVPLVASYIYAPYVPRFSLASTKLILGFSVWVTLNQFITVIGNRFDNLVIAGVLGTATFGAYNVGNNVATMLTQQAIQPLERVFFPSFVHIVHDKARLRAAFQRSQSSLFAVGLPLGVGAALVAEPLVSLALGPRWHLAAVVIQLIAPVLGVQVVFGAVNAVAYALGATKDLFRRSLWQTAIRVPIVLAGLYVWGLTGLLIARIISGGVLTSVLNLMLVHKLTGLTVLEQLKVTWRSIVSMVVMVIAALAVRSLFPSVEHHTDALYATVAIIGVGGFAYVATHAVVWFMAGRPGNSIEAEFARLLSKTTGRFARLRNA